jgi:hypothetical protein
MKSDQSIVALLDAVPQTRLSSEKKKRHIKLHNSLNELGRFDEATGDTLVDEKILRKLLKEYAPPGFEERCLTFLRTAPDSHLLVADWGSRKTVKSVDWQTALGRTAAGKSPGATLESLGLSPRSTNQDLKQALQQRMPDLSDQLFEPDAAASLEATVNGMAGMFGNPDEYWRRFTSCMGGAVPTWLSLSAFFFFFGLIQSGYNVLVALIVVFGWTVVFWAISLVVCLITAAL